MSSPRRQNGNVDLHLVQGKLYMRYRRYGKDDPVEGALFSEPVTAEHITHAEQGGAMTSQPSRLWVFDNNQVMPSGMQPGDLALNSGCFPRVLICTRPSMRDGVLERGILSRWDGERFRKSELHCLVSNDE